jgi:hypothetical protein
MYPGSHASLIQVRRTVPLLGVAQKIRQLGDIRRDPPRPTIISSPPQYTRLRSFVIRGWRTGISNTDAVVIYGLFALLARHVIAMHDTISLGAPGI